jgi:hypothetical protein
MIGIVRHRTNFMLFQHSVGRRQCRRSLARSGSHNRPVPRDGAEGAGAERLAGLLFESNALALLTVHLLAQIAQLVRRPNLLLPHTAF